MSLWNPVIGYWIDSAKQQAQQTHVSAEQIEVVAGQAVLQNLLIFPIVLIVVFIGLNIFITKHKNVEKYV